MAVESPAYVISADYHSAALFRQTAQSLLQGHGFASFFTNFQVAQRAAGANMSVDVPIVTMWVAGTQGNPLAIQPNVTAQAYTGALADFTDQGSYCAYNDAVENLPIAASNPDFPRIDLVCMSIQDAFYSGSFNQPVLQIITGTPSSAPVAPSIPVNTYVCAQVAVAAGVTSITTGNITNVSVSMKAAHGGIASFYTGQQNMVGGLSAPFLQANGLAEAGARFVGGTDGAPISGTWNQGDFMVQPGNGLSGAAEFWICTAGGTPGTWQSAGSGSGGPLASVNYSGGSAYSISAGSLTAVDTTNATIAFTAPASGKVDVTAAFTWVTNSTTVGAVIGLLDHTSHAQVGLDIVIGYQFASGNVEYANTIFHITGLTPGDSYQYDLAACLLSGAGWAIFCGGNPFGSFTSALDMRVTAGL